MLSHNVFIEEGPHHNIAHEPRLCKYCTMNIIENEYHFYSDLRRTLLPKYNCSWPNIHKCIALITTNNSTLLKRLSSYLDNANKRRI